LQENNKNNNKQDYTELIKAALEARNFSHSPYSHFRVGAAVLSDEGKIFTGTNIENASYPATICAERVAVSKAVSEGYKNIKAVAITSSYDEFVFPCGVCRQFMVEFAVKNDIDIVLALSAEKFEIHNLKDLIPHSFILKNE